MVTSTKPKGKHDRRADDTASDRGCLYAPRCTTCIFRRCIAELTPSERAEFADAWRVVIAHIAPPDRAIDANA